MKEELETDKVTWRSDMECLFCAKILLWNKVSETVEIEDVMILNLWNEQAAW